MARKKSSDELLPGKAARSAALARLEAAKEALKAAKEQTAKEFGQLCIEAGLDDDDVIITSRAALLDKLKEVAAHFRQKPQAGEKPAANAAQAGKAGGSASGT